MEQAILTDVQKKALNVVFDEPKLNDFYLTGGTALSVYYFQHRISDDLDFFTANEPDKQFLHIFAERLKTIVGANSYRFEHPYDRNIFLFSIADSELKIEFTYYPFQQLEAPVIYEGVRVDSLRDIAANKIMALIDRFDPKDFVDLFFILKQKTLKEILYDMEKKFDFTIEALTLGSEFAKAQRIEALPKMIKSLTVEELKIFFAELAKTFREEVLGNNMDFSEGLDK
ncbi:nucleotidyl transferase AbiEii/AbiGii toxin family protein [Patescibacteria group bacterium]|nr:nucleotidyl transferase AbiEii/AbiGii toxin family protein [Patescibacteria group bacterium]